MEVLEAPVSRFYEATIQMVENIKSLKIQDNYYVQKVTDVAAKTFMASYEIRYTVCMYRIYFSCGKHWVFSIEYSWVDH